MWIASKFGFFSIVADERNQKFFQVRARVKKDLENLREAACVRDRGIIDTPEADYPCRIIVDASQLQKIMSALALGVDYTNFKNSLKGTDQEPKLKMYHQWWADWFSFKKKNI